MSFDRCSLLGLLLLTLPLSLHAASEPAQSPWWRGMYGTGTSSVPASEPLRERPRLRWHSKEFTKTSHGDLKTANLVGGCQSLVMHDDKIYVSYFIGSQDPVVLDVAADDKKNQARFRGFLNGTDKKGPCKGHPGSLGLDRVGFTEADYDKLVNMICNIHADDVMVCLDANTGETKWKTAVPGGVNILKQNYGPHYSPAVDPTTGIVYSLATMGRLCAFDGQTGELLWQRQIAKKWNTIKAEALQKRQSPPIVRREYQCAYAVDGVVVVGGRAFDGATGEVLWTTKTASWIWVPWQHDGKWYLINGGTRCIDPQTGADLWQLSKEELAAVKLGCQGMIIGVYGNILLTEKAAYTISPTSRERLWYNERLHNGHTSGLTVLGDSMYMVAYDPTLIEQVNNDNPSADFRDYSRALKKALKNKKTCYLLQINLQTGSIDKQWKFDTSYEFASGSNLLAIGKRLFWLKKGGPSYLFDPQAISTEGFDWSQHVISKLVPGHGSPLAIYRVQTPVVHGNRIYARAGWSVLCLDFAQ